MVCGRTFLTHACVCSYLLCMLAHARGCSADNPSVTVRQHFVGQGGCAPLSLPGHIMSSWLGSQIIRHRANCACLRAPSAEVPACPLACRLRMKARALEAALAWQRLKARHSRGSSSRRKGRISRPLTPKDGRELIQVGWLMQGWPRIHSSRWVVEVKGHLRRMLTSRVGSCVHLPRPMRV